MDNQDWLVTDDGSSHPFAVTEEDEGDKPYRLYRFLTDLEDILDNIADDAQRLAAMRPLVRRLLTRSYWLQGEYFEPDPQRGWSVNTLYRETDFPITVQMVCWSPGQVSPVHNHCAWGLVALISGEEKNRIWQRNPDKNHLHRLKMTQEVLLQPGDIITFTPEAIHQVEVIGDEPTVSFNLYGETDFERRLEFDPINHTAKSF